MTNIKTKIKVQIEELGFLGRVIIGTYRWLRNALLRLTWYFFRLKYKDYRPDPTKGEIHFKPPRNPEEIVRLIFSQSKGQSFLEIGIGASPNIERIRLMSQNDIKYTGCDFKEVCDSHQVIIKRYQDIDSNLRFLGNQVGTYSWTLFELLRKGEKFDIIYLDGHHTFYVDCSALVLAHLLLKPGGYFLLDDIRWTLKFLQNVLVTSFTEWSFYRKMYDFSHYEEKQQTLPHIGMMTEAILLDRLKYTKIDEYSMPDWWALRKPFV